MKIISKQTSCCCCCCRCSIGCEDASWGKLEPCSMFECSTSDISSRCGSIGWIHYGQAKLILDYHDGGQNLGNSHNQWSSRVKRVKRNETKHKSWYACCACCCCCWINVIHQTASHLHCAIVDNRICRVVLCLFRFVFLVSFLELFSIESVVPDQE